MAVRRTTIEFSAISMLLVLWIPGIVLIVLGEQQMPEEIFPKRIPVVEKIGTNKLYPRSDANGELVDSDHPPEPPNQDYKFEQINMQHESLGYRAEKERELQQLCDPTKEWCDDYVDLSPLSPKALSPFCDMREYKCELPAQSNEFTGVCLPQSYVQKHISFCQSRVCYDACVPPLQTQHPEWTLTAKDKIVEKFFKALVEKRMRKETNNTIYNSVALVMTYKPDCIEAFKDALCYLNFPKCGCSRESLPLCESVCKNYYNACGGGTQDGTGNILECGKDFIVSNGLFASFVGDRSNAKIPPPNGDPAPVYSLGEFSEVCPVEIEGMPTGMRRLGIPLTNQSPPEAGNLSIHDARNENESTVEAQDKHQGEPYRRRASQFITPRCAKARQAVDVEADKLNVDNEQVTPVGEVHEPSLIPITLCIIIAFALIGFHLLLNVIFPKTVPNGRPNSRPGSREAQKRLVALAKQGLAVIPEEQVATINAKSVGRHSCFKISMVVLVIAFSLSFLQYLLQSAAMASTASDGSYIVLTCFEGKQFVSGTCAKRLRWPQVTQLGCSTTCTGDAMGRTPYTGVMMLLISMWFFVFDSVSVSI